eukprot:Skav225503  [mRNA]  locus=scaffold1721:175548:175805:- [translate_table: standard]
MDVPMCLVDVPNSCPFPSHGTIDGCLSTRELPYHGGCGRGRPPSLDEFYEERLFRSAPGSKVDALRSKAQPGRHRPWDRLEIQQL